MSMLSIQCDELRELADSIGKLANGQVNQGFPARVKLHEAADALREAADTIESLRNRFDGTQQGEFVGCLDGEWNTVLDQGQPIVRCRDCKHYREHEFVLITDVSDVCLFWADGVKVAPDGFCAWASKRKEADE